MLYTEKKGECCFEIIFGMFSFEFCLGDQKLNLNNNDIFSCFVWTWPCPWYWWWLHGFWEAGRSLDAHTQQLCAEDSLHAVMRRQRKEKASFSESESLSLPPSLPLLSLPLSPTPLSLFTLFVTFTESSGFFNSLTTVASSPSSTAASNSCVSLIDSWNNSKQSFYFQ